jgi:hypothetical protein
MSDSQYQGAAGTLFFHTMPKKGAKNRLFFLIFFLGVLDHSAYFQKNVFT